MKRFFQLQPYGKLGGLIDLEKRHLLAFQSNPNQTPTRFHAHLPADTQAAYPAIGRLPRLARSSGTIRRANQNPHENTGKRTFEPKRGESRRKDLACKGNRQPAHDKSRPPGSTDAPIREQRRTQLPPRPVFSRKSIDDEKTREKHLARDGAPVDLEAACARRAARTPIRRPRWQPQG